MTTTRSTATAVTGVTGSCGATPRSSERAKRLLANAVARPIRAAADGEGDRLHHNNDTND
ncbi:MAG: hypothetical protein ACRD15_10910 [Vicinamibacterales bacterium]